MEYYSFHSTMNKSTFTSFHAFVFSIFSFPITSLIFLLPTKTSYEKNKSPDLNSIHWAWFFFFQNNSTLQNMKCDGSISFMQTRRNRTHPIFQKLYHTNICTWSLYESAILHGQASWIIEVVSSKSFNLRPPLNR